MIRRYLLRQSSIPPLRHSSPFLPHAPSFGYSIGISFACSECPFGRFQARIDALEAALARGEVPVQEVKKSVKEFTLSTAEARDARDRWQPVSRRRFRGKGWHIDVGPGFPNDGLRYAAGHPFQCVVLLLLLSDSDAGGGGTVMIPGSHRMVEAKLKNEEPAGVSHENLNAWCVQQVLAAVKSETLWSGVCAVP